MIKSQLLVFIMSFKRQLDFKEIRLLYFKRKGWLYMGVINYADKYSNILDEKFKVESKSDIAVNQDYDFVGAKTVKIQSVNTVELSNYTRSGSNRYGTPNELDNAIQEMTMSQDKSFTFTIDKMNKLSNQYGHKWNFITGNQL